MLYRCKSHDIQAAIQWLEEAFSDRYSILENGSNTWPSNNARDGHHFTLHLTANDGMLLKLMK